MPDLGASKAGSAAPAPEGAAADGVAVAERGGFSAFLDALRAFESGIDPERHAFYVENFRRPVLQYPPVSSPGEVVRDPETGGYAPEPCTVEEYFRRLGVLHLFDEQRPRSLVAMQYASTNALGFVGYQLGEAVLIDTGYYRAARRPVAAGNLSPEDAQAHRDGEPPTCDSLYVGGIDDRAWRDGRTTHLHRSPDTGELVLATHVNRWRGEFLGKAGISSFDDLRGQAAQEILIRDILRFNHDRLVRRLAENGAELGPLLAQALPRSGPAATVSGVLAAAHLCGAYGAADALVQGTAPSDEFGTSMHAYLARFSGYRTPFDRESAP